MKRKIAALLSLLLLCTLLPQPLDAVQTVYFTSADDMLLDLSDDTMPFWQGSTLYVSSMVFDSTKSDLGTAFSLSRDKTVAIIYKSREVLTFDLAEGTIENNSTHEIIPGNAILRGDSVFFPVAVVAKFFGLDYSCVKVECGYLVRVKSDKVVLSDTAFIDAASAPMQQRYDQYRKTHPAAAPQEANKNENTLKDGAAYFLISVSDEQSAQQCLAALASAKSTATFLLSEQKILAMPDLVRRIVAGGNAVALEAPALSDATAVLSAIAQANDALWTVSNTKTRLVFLSDAGTGREASLGAGCCPITAELDFQENLPSASRIQSRISTLVGENGRCIAFLGEDANAQGVLPGVLSLLRSGGCHAQRLNETVV